MDRNRLQRVAPWIGVVAVVVTFGGIGLGIAFSPSFGLTENALSNLGVADHSAGTDTTALVFNGGLIVGGALGGAFGVALAAIVSHPVERTGAVLFGLALVSMGAVGVFPQDGPYHFEAAAGFYLLFSIAVLVYAVGQLLTGERRSGALSAVAGLGNLAVWIGWGLTGSLTRAGLALPELLGAAMVVLWVVATANTLRAGDHTQSPQPFAWEQ